MTVTLPDWMTTTGPIDYQDLEALRADPYLRDTAGRFAPHPADVPSHPADVPSHLEHVGAGGAAVISYEGTNTGRHRVRVDRDQTGRLHVTYLDEATR